MTELQHTLYFTQASHFLSLNDRLKANYPQCLFTKQFCGWISDLKFLGSCSLNGLFVHYFHCNVIFLIFFLKETLPFIQPFIMKNFKHTEAEWAVKRIPMYSTPKTINSRCPGLDLGPEEKKPLFSIKNSVRVSQTYVPWKCRHSASSGKEGESVRAVFCKVEWFFKCLLIICVFSVVNYRLGPLSIYISSLKAFPSLMFIEFLRFHFLIEKFKRASVFKK